MGSVHGVAFFIQKIGLLERLYKIESVCHIHGNVAKWEELIFGYCDPGYPKKDFKEYEHNAYEIFEEIYRRYIRDTKKQIERNSEFFNSILLSAVLLLTVVLFAAP